MNPKLKKLLIIGGSLFLAHASLKMFYTQFTADEHTQIRSGCNIEDIYYQNRINGTTGCIRRYVSTASRIITIIPYEYFENDSEFDRLLNLRKKN